MNLRLEFVPGSRCRSGWCGAIFTAWRRVQVAALPLAALFLSFAPAAAQPQALPATTVVIFSDHPMPASQWDFLFADLRASLTAGDAETRPLDSDARFIRGDELTSGVAVDSAITVFLHGDCALAPLTHRTAYGAPLGWVRRVDGHIEPFVHVDCSEIGKVLGSQVRWYGKRARSEAMAGAMARVILHEWIHIATQSPHHAENGVAKAQFGVNDLMEGEQNPALSGSGR